MARSTAYCVLIRGPLGVGKSTISSALARFLGADHIQIDQILENHDLEEWDADRISLKSFLQANVFAAEQALAALENGRPVVLDGCFYWREQIDDLLRRLDCPQFSFTLDAPLRVCVARDGTRPMPPPGSMPRGGDQQGAEAAAAVHDLVAHVRYGLPIDATGTVEATLTSIVTHLPGRTAVD